MALNGLFCADVPLRNYSLTHLLHFSPCVFCSLFSVCFYNMQRSILLDDNTYLLNLLFVFVMFVLILGHFSFISLQFTNFSVHFMLLMLLHLFFIIFHWIFPDLFF